MSLEKVKKYFDEIGLDKKIIEFDTRIATVDEAAAAIGCEGARIAKTMAFYYEDSCILVVTCGDTKIDNARFKARFGTKARMVAYDDVADVVGHVPGGVCPFAPNDGIKVYLDESLKRFESVFPSCGSINSAAEFTIPELERYTLYDSWVDVCKVKE